MVNFKKLVKKKREVEITDFIKLFESLDRKTSHTELRPTQREVLIEMGKRRKEKDFVLKIGTGVGKTAVGLLYLQSFMEESEEPAVYLCPTVQLVEQVRDEALSLGINAVIYPKGEPHPDVEGLSAKAVIVCTYDKLFNAKSTFNREDVHLRPCAIALDDVHAGIEEIRDSFTLRITEPELCQSLIKLLTPACEKYKKSTWMAIQDGDPNESMEIPYWIWKALVDEIFRLLSPFSKTDSFKFVWPYITEILRWCRCIVSSVGIEIMPDMLPVNKIEAFANAQHRLFMSATLADDSPLVRELGCDLSSAQNPILPNYDRGIGERMILAPSLVDKKFDRLWIMELCKRFCKKVNVVVLSPSEQKAKEWERIGAKVVLSDEVSEAIMSLKKCPGGQCICFAQRYDGVDLPDNACRILIIDGMPYGEGIIERHDSALHSIATGMHNRLIYRIEQGMGRAVRSHVDYAVIILSGPELASFIAQKDVVKMMTLDTRNQLKLAQDLAKIAKEDEADNADKALTDMIIKCLARDSDWKQYYDENVRKAEKTTPKKTDDAHLILSEIERKAFGFVRANNHEKAVEIIRKGINDNGVIAKEKGWYLQKAANYMFEYNEGEAFGIQRAAYDNNETLFCPPVGATLRPVNISKFNSQQKILQWFQNFAHPNGAIAKIQELRARLSYEVSAATMEETVKELAPLLGAIGSRPENEYNEGPDDLWVWPSMSLVIEVKNGNDKSLHKSDAEQLLHSMEWFKKQCPAGKGVPVTIAKVIAIDKGVCYPEHTRIITPAKMVQLLDNLENFFQRMIKEPLLYCSPEAIVKLQNDFHLNQEQFLAHYSLGIK